MRTDLAVDKRHPISELGVTELLNLARDRGYIQKWHHDAGKLWLHVAAGCIILTAESARAFLLRLFDMMGE